MYGSVPGKELFLGEVCLMQWFCIQDWGVSASNEHWTLLTGVLIMQETERILLLLIE